MFNLWFFRFFNNLFKNKNKPPIRMFAIKHRMSADMFSGFCAILFFLASPSLLQLRRWWLLITDTKHRLMNDRRHWTERVGK